MQIAKAHLPATDMRRLKQLMAKSERGTLPPKELDEYRALAQQVEQLNVTRVEALAELVQRQGQPMNIVGAPYYSIRPDPWQGVTVT